MYGDLLPILRGADVAAVNVECVLSDENRHPILKEGVAIHGPEAAAEGLRAASFQLACLANNHTLDWGPEGLADTRRVLERAGLRCIGAGETPAQAEQPAIFDAGGWRVAVLNAAEGEESSGAYDQPGAATFCEQRLARQVENLTQRVDVVIVILHAGREYIPLPPPYICRAYRTLVDAGADLVVGHHPHVPQGVEVYRGRPICYSLGNFVFPTRFGGRPFSRRGYAVQANFARDGIGSLRLLPYEITEQGPRLLRGASKAAFLKNLQRVSEVTAQPALVEEAWNAYCDDWFRRTGQFQLWSLTKERPNEWSLLLGALKCLRHRLSCFSDREWLRALPSRIRAKADKRSDQHTRSAAGGFDRCRFPSRASKIATKLRNKFQTPAHRELYLTALARAMNDQTGDWPDWARELYETWGAIDADPPRRSVA